MKRIGILVAVFLLLLPAAVHAAAPEVTYISITSLTCNSVVLKVAITPNADSVNFYVEWGLTPSYGNKTPTSTLQGEPKFFVAKGLTGLTPNTTYHYRIVAQNSAGQTQGADMSFKTPPTPPMPTDEKLDAPRTSAALNITSTMATLAGVINPQAGNITYHFEYGLTTAYGKSTSPLAIHGSSGNVFYVLTGLAPNTTYHYRIVIESRLSGNSRQGADMSFKTSGPLPGPQKDIDLAADLLIQVLSKKDNSNGRIRLIGYVKNVGKYTCQLKPDLQRFVLYQTDSDCKQIIKTLVDKKSVAVLQPPAPVRGKVPLKAVSQEGGIVEIRPGQSIKVFEYDTDWGFMEFGPGYKTLFQLQGENNSANNSKGFTHKQVLTNFQQARPVQK